MEKIISFIRGSFPILVIIAIVIIYLSRNMQESKILPGKSGESDSLVISPHISTQAATLSPSGRIIATAGTDFCVKIWDSLSGSLQKKIKRSAWTTDRLCISPDDQFLAAGGISPVEVYHLQDATRVSTLERSDPVHQLIFGSSTSKLAGCTFSRISVWDPLSGKITLSFTPSGRPKIKSTAAA